MWDPSFQHAQNRRIVVAAGKLEMLPGTEYALGGTTRMQFLGVHTHIEPQTILLSFRVIESNSVPLSNIRVNHSPWCPLTPMQK